MSGQCVDIISYDTTSTLSELFAARVARSGDRVGTKYFDKNKHIWRSLSWQQLGDRSARIQAVIRGQALQQGEKIAIMACNSPWWLCAEQAALGLGLVVVPLFVNDRGENAAYIIDHAEAKILFIDGHEQWKLLQDVADKIADVTLISFERFEPGSSKLSIQFLDDLLPETAPELEVYHGQRDELATIVYTSGTTGRPKGVMLSHNNILWNVSRSLDAVRIYTHDLFLSFLPLSHMFERTAGHYLVISAGATIAYVRSIPHLREDLQTIRPTVLIAVPRIYERIYNTMQEKLLSGSPMQRKMVDFAINIGWQFFQWQQRRASWQPRFLLIPLVRLLISSKIMANLGGRLRLSISGGAPLSEKVAQTFIGLGLPLLQGYGLTETSPVMCVNRINHNRPETVGPVLNDVEVKTSEIGELITRGPGVMLGYWKNEEATREVIDENGWFKTGDLAKIEDDYVRITGRVKEIIVLANGEKVPPADMELSIITDPLFEQAMVIGEGKPFLSALLVLSREQWLHFVKSSGLSEQDALHDHHVEQQIVRRLAESLSAFPGYAQIRRVWLTLTPWTIDEGLLTPTLKLRRKQINERFHNELEHLYEGR